MEPYQLVYCFEVIFSCHINEALDTKLLIIIHLISK